MKKHFLPYQSSKNITASAGSNHIIFSPLVASASLRLIEARNRNDTLVEYVQAKAMDHLVILYIFCLFTIQSLYTTESKIVVTEKTELQKQNKADKQGFLTSADSIAENLIAGVFGAKTEKNKDEVVAKKSRNSRIDVLRDNDLEFKPSKQIPWQPNLNQRSEAAFGFEPLISAHDLNPATISRGDQRQDKRQDIFLGGPKDIVFVVDPVDTFTSPTTERPRFNPLNILSNIIEGPRRRRRKKKKTQVIKTLLPPQNNVRPNPTVPQNVAIQTVPQNVPPQVPQNVPNTVPQNVPNTVPQIIPQIVPQTVFIEETTKAPPQQVKSVKKPERIEVTTEIPHIGPNVDSGKVTED